MGKCGMSCQTQGRSYGGAGHEVRDMSHVSYLSDEVLHVATEPPMNLLMCVHVSHNGHRCDSWLAIMSALQQ